MSNRVQPHSYYSCTIVIPDVLLWWSFTIIFFSNNIWFFLQSKSNTIEVDRKYFLWKRFYCIQNKILKSLFLCCLENRGIYFFLLFVLKYFRFLFILYIFEDTIILRHDLKTDRGFPKQPTYFTYFCIRPLFTPMF